MIKKYVKSKQRKSKAFISHLKLKPSVEVRTELEPLTYEGKVQILSVK